MHARAKARGFDFGNCGQYRIKDYPQYFLDPLGPTQQVMQEPTKIEEHGKQGPSSPHHQQQYQYLQLPVHPVSESPTDVATLQPAPVNVMVSLAAEAAGVVGAGTSYSSNQAVIAAAAELQQQQQQPLEVAAEDMTHVIPALPPPPGNHMNMHDAMKSLDFPNLGGTAV